MRVVQIFDTLRVGGAQKMLVFLASSLQPLGVDLTVVNLSQHSDPALVKQLQSLGVRVVEIPFPRLFSPLAFYQLVKFLRQEKFDLAHAYLTYSNIIGPLAGRLIGLPVIASLRSAEYRRRNVREKLEDFSLQHLAKLVMANGKAVGEFARKRSGKTPVDVVVNAVDMIPALPESERNLIRQELVGDSRRPLVFSAGTLATVKGFSDLLDAFKIVHAAHPEAALVIAGGGVLMDDLTKRAREHQLQNDVFLLGLRNDVPRLLASVDIYVNSSHREGTPVSILEAMSAGLPVVATTVGESPFLVSPETGYLVPPAQPEQMAVAINALLAAPQQRVEMGSVARRQIQQDYERASWRRNMLAMYAKLAPKANDYLAKLSANSLPPAEGS